MAMKFSAAGFAGSTNNLHDDVTLTFNGTGPGTTPFSWDNLVHILYQAFTASLERSENISLLPKKFVLISYLTKSCRIVQKVCLPPGYNYEEELCRPRWRLLLGTGQSGSKYFLSANDDFIIKTVPLKEHTCLSEILPRLCQILTDNPRTLLPRFFGLYSYEGDGKTVRFMVMNNILPNNLHVDMRFDLKGAIKRKTASHVYKDDAFLKTYPSGFEMDEAYVHALRQLFELDCMHLKELELTSYSLFIVLHEVNKDDDDENVRVTDDDIDEHVIPPKSLGLLQLVTDI